MELWIRSQDKLTLMKATYVYVAREEVCAYDENKCWSAIGIYKSQERALEVLDEIQEKVKNSVGIQKNKSYTEGSYRNHELIIDIPYAKTIVYEMPEE